MSHFFGNGKKNPVFKRVFHSFNRVINNCGEKRKKVFWVKLNENRREISLKIISICRISYNVKFKIFPAAKRGEKPRNTIYCVRRFSEKGQRRGARYHET